MNSRMRTWISGVLCFFAVFGAMAVQGAEESADRSVESPLRAELAAFLGAGSPEAKAAIASRVVSAIVLQPDADRIRADLAEATGALVGASGDAAPEVAVAIMKAVGTNYVDVAASAIAIAASLAPNPEDVREATIEAAPDGSKESVRLILAQGEQLFDRELQQTVLHAAKGFKLVRDNWDPGQGKLKKDLFSDHDGGESACVRNEEGK